MTTDLATVPEFRESLKLSGRDREAARGRRLRPQGPQTSEHQPGLRLHLAALPGMGRNRRTPDTARDPPSCGPIPELPGSSRQAHGHYRAGPRCRLPFPPRRRDAEGRHPARHPVVAEAVRGWRNRASAPRQFDALTADGLARVREVLRCSPRRGRGGRQGSPETVQFHRNEARSETNQSAEGADAIPGPTAVKASLDICTNNGCVN